MTIADDEYGWVKLNYIHPKNNDAWKLVRGPNDPRSYGVLAKWQKCWTVSIIGELMAELPRTLNTDDAQNAAKLILLSLKDSI